MLYKRLFELKRKQEADRGGEYGNILEYDRPVNAVDLPSKKVVLPREKPAPKEKPKTKWEKFREEKGMPAR